MSLRILYQCYTSSHKDLYYSLQDGSVLLSWYDGTEFAHWPGIQGTPRPSSTPIPRRHFRDKLPPHTNTGEPHLTSPTAQKVVREHHRPSKLAPSNPRRASPRSHISATLLRCLFPQTRKRARAHLSKLRHEYFPSLRHRAHSRIYQYIVQRHLRKELRKTPSILARLRGRGQKLSGLKSQRALKDAVGQKWSKMTLDPAYDRRESSATQSGGMATAEGAGGSRRARLRGYLKAANELRQTYQQQYASGWANRESWMENAEEGDAFPDAAAVVRSGDEQMVLFPSYARRHVKIKPKAQPGTIQEQSGEGRDVRDSVGDGDAGYWKQQWEEYEDDNAVVDVDVRGWVFSPHKGQMTRKQRIFISLARQLAGLPAPPSPDASQQISRSASPHSSTREQEVASKEAASIVQNGQAKAEAAGRGEYSETPTKDSLTEQRASRPREVDDSNDLRKLAASNAAADDDNDPKITPIQKRASWNHPDEMTPAELSMAHSHLMARLKPFISNPLANTSVSAFFYNDDVSRQRTIYTDAYGHFNLRAALNFIPTNVRILASENLSATEEVIVTDPNGVSVISDIDDTIKHSAISSGAREIFRNAFIRDLNDLTIDGVQEWYGRLAKMGVKFHYVSNSPWQLYPVITKFFAEAGLPTGSFHLKQYSGMLQGIFEPVAERKKGTLDRIAGDFPHRRFILVGDSGEADLEVYLDFVSENPGRVLGVFIRDVTTPATKGGFFDSSMGPLTGSRHGSTSNKAAASVKTQSSSEDDEDPEIKAAIAASLKDMENEERRSRPSLPPRRTTEVVDKQSQREENLIDLSDEEPLPSSKRGSTTSSNTARSMPPVPRKPVALRTSSTSSEAGSIKKKAPPPPPSRRSTNRVPESTSQEAPPPIPRSSKPPPLSSDEQSYATSTKQAVSSAYSHLPNAPWSSNDNDLRPPMNASNSHDNNPANSSKPALLPPPPRRAITSYPAAAASYTTTRLGNAWNGTSYPTQTSRDQRFSTSSVSGQNGNGQPLNKKEELWKQRWKRAEHFLKEKGVVLRAWRVGTDVLEESVKLVEKAKREDEKSGRRER